MRGAAANIALTRRPSARALALRMPGATRTTRFGRAPLVALARRLPGPRRTGWARRRTLRPLRSRRASRSRSSCCVGDALDRDAWIAFVGAPRLRFEEIGDFGRDVDRRRFRLDSNGADFLARDSAASARVREDSARGRSTALAPADSELREILDEGTRIVSAAGPTLRLGPLPGGLERIEPLHLHWLVCRLGNRQLQQRRDRDASGPSPREAASRRSSRLRSVRIPRDARASCGGPV